MQQDCGACSEPSEKSHLVHIRPISSVFSSAGSEFCFGSASQPLPLLATSVSMIFVIASEAKQSPSLQASPRIAVDTEHLLTVFNKCGRGTRKTQNDAFGGGGHRRSEPPHRHKTVDGLNNRLHRMNKRRSMGWTLFVYVFALLWFFSVIFAQRAIADEGSLSLSGLLQLRYDGRYLSHGLDDDHKLHQIADGPGSFPCTT